MNRTLLFVPIIALILWANPYSILYAKQGPGNKYRSKGIHTQLSAEQQSAVADKFQELWEKGLPHNEIHQEISKMLKEYGVQVPERNRQAKHPWEDQLTNEQRAAIRKQRTEMEKAGVSRQEIHEKIQQMLSEYGIDASEFPMSRGPRGPRGLKPHGWLKQRLSEEQFEEFQSKLEDMRKQGIPAQELRENVQKLLEGYGIDPSQQKPPHPGRRQLHGWLKNNLNKEQFQKVQDKLETLHEQGASREEVHAEIKALVAEFGIKLPESRQRNREFRDDLTPQQRQEMQQKRQKMFESGATPEEIHQEMQKLLESYNTENDSMFPEKNDQQIDELEDGLQLQTYPNPFNPQTTFEYKIQNPTHVSMRIYNINGQLVNVLVDDYRQAGTYMLTWNGLNKNGQQVPSGIYFLQLNAGNESRSERIVLMK